jgi:hypothetical protein
VPSKSVKGPPPAHLLKQFERELGLLGKLLGSRQEKPGNISAVVILFSLAGLAWILSSVRPVLSSDHFISSLFSLITLALGYLFGSHQKN